MTIGTFPVTHATEPERLVQSFEQILRETIQTTMEKLLQQNIQLLQHSMRGQHDILATELGLHRTMLESLALQSRHHDNFSECPSAKSEPPPQRPLCESRPSDVEWENTELDAAMNPGQTLDQLQVTIELQDPTPVLNRLHSSSGASGAGELKELKTHKSVKDLTHEAKLRRRKRVTGRVFQSIAQAIGAAEDIVRGESHTRLDYNIQIWRQDLVHSYEIQDHMRLKLLDLFEWCYEWWMSLREPERTGRLASFVSASRFDSMVLLVIVLNCTVVAIEANYDIIYLNEEPDKFMMVSSYFFSAFFAMELVLKLCVQLGHPGGSRYTANRDRTLAQLRKKSTKKRKNNNMKKH